MLRDHLASLVASAIDALIASGKLPEAVRDVPVEIIDTKQPEHGDYACNFAMMATKKAGLNPREIGELLKGQLVNSVSGGERTASNNMVSEGDPNTGSDFGPFAIIEVAGPGFINFRLRPEFVASYVPRVLELGDRIALAESGAGSPHSKVNVEFVSVNPNGPITVGSGRGAAFGDTLCRVLSAAGHEVNREYYINDGVNSEQMRQFAESVRSYVEELPFPEKGYKGDYVVAIADAVKGMLVGAGTQLGSWYQDVSQRLMIERQRRDLETFGVRFDTWFSEQTLHDSGKVEEMLQQLVAKGVADCEPYRLKLEFNRDGSIKSVAREEQPGEEEDGDGGADPNTQQPIPSTGASHPTPHASTLWLRSTKFGDDMDRVLRRRDGRLTYIASDVAYHADKFNRPPNADKLLTILGPDHHGYIARLHAVVAAFLEEPSLAVSREPSAEQEGGTADGKRPTANDLNEVEALVYRSPAERDACLRALQLSQEKLEVVIFQIVRFLKDGKPAPMRKRDGNIYELRDLITELGQAAAPNEPEEEQLRVGRDVARFFYLMRSHDTHVDFDIDLATKQSDENPVFYAQYAHARICSVLSKAGEAASAHTEPFTIDTSRLTLLIHPKESALIKKILDLPWEVGRCAQDYGVHRLTTYAVELARTFHHFYDACRVLQPEHPELTAARLALCHATRMALKATFDLLGVSAPEKMERSQPL